MNTQAGFRAALSYPKFAAIYFSEAISLIGDRIAMIALITLVYQLTDSAAAVSALMLLKALPALVLGVAAGAMVDRLNRKWLMVLSNLFQGALVLMLPYTHTLTTIYAIYFTMSVINQFFIPARSATIPDILPPNLLLTANALASISYVAGIAFGPAIAGILIDTYGISTAFYVDVFTFLIPAAVVATLALPHNTQTAAKQNILADLRTGFSYIRAHRKVQASLLLAAASYLGVGVTSVLGIIFASDILGVGASGYGMLMSSMGVGLLAGAVAIGRWGNRFDRLHLAVFGAILSGITIALLPWSPTLAVALGIGTINGFGTIVVQTSALTTFQSVPDGLRGRIMGVAQAMLGASAIIAMGMAGLFAELLGLHAVFGLAGLVAALAGAYVGGRIYVRHYRTAHP